MIVTFGFGQSLQIKNKNLSIQVDSFCMGHTLRLLKALQSFNTGKKELTLSRLSRILANPMHSAFSSFLNALGSYSNKDLQSTSLYLFLLQSTEYYSHCNA